MEFKTLTEILDNLPNTVDINGKSFKPKFDYGTQADLLKYLSLKKKGRRKTNTYPLVWLQTGFAMVRKGNIETGTLNFILATISSRDISNRDRTKQSFLQILDPLVLSVEKAINANYGTRISRNGQVTTKYFNYENDLEKGATDIWDAIAFEVEFTINLDCIN